MIRIMLYISDLIVPFLIFYVVAEGLAAKRPVYDDFVKGAKDGLKTVVQILPTLVGLMVAVGVLRASGFLDFLAGLLGGLTKRCISRRSFCRWLSCGCSRLRRPQGWRWIFLRSMGRTAMWGWRRPL